MKFDEYGSQGGSTRTMNTGNIEGPSDGFSRQLFMSQCIYMLQIRNINKLFR